jgi:methylated-DNA-[protein]-cysteine S-methyltransferase
VAGQSRLRWGSGLLALAYFWAGHGSLLSLVHAELGPSHGIASGLALVTVALVAVEILVVLVPLRRGEKWAFWAALLPVVLVGIPRMLTDPTCTAMSLSVHGCHQLMGALLGSSGIHHGLSWLAAQQSGADGSLKVRDQMETLHYSRIESPVGILLLAASEQGLVRLEFARGGAGDLPESWTENREKMAPYVRELADYFAGERTEFSFPLDLRGTEFQQRCWRALLEIPYGETRSYADIARAVGSPRGFRAVGMANNRNPVAIVVPCHRVVASDGTLCGYGGGLDVKEQLLDLEKGKKALAVAS